MLKRRYLSIFPLFLVSLFLIFPVNCENITFSLDSAESTQLLNQLISSALQQLNVQVPIDPIRVNISADNGQYGVQLQLTVNGNVIVSKSEFPTDDGVEVEENTLERENAFGVYTFPGTEMAGLEALTTTDLPDASPSARLEAIKSLARQAWINLISYHPTWPILGPRDRFYVNFVNGELIGAMSTLHLMDLSEEFAQGRKRIEDQLSLGNASLAEWRAGKAVYQDQDMVYNYVNKYIGGLLACYTLTEEEWYLEKAKEMADFLEPAYGNIPDWYHTTKGYHLDYDAMFNQQLEYRFLADLSEEAKYWDRLGLIQHAAIDYQKMADSDLKNKVLKRLKSYIQSNRQNRPGIGDYLDILQEAENRHQFPVTRSGLTYYQQARGWTSMNDQRQAFGAMLALGAKAQQEVLDSRFIDRQEKERWEERIARHYKLADQITETFYLATKVSGRGLPPGDFRINAYAIDRESTLGYFKGEGVEVYLAESYFVLYRLTKQEKYREYAWELVKALSVNGTADKEARLPHSMYLSATLKYLWLIFSEGDVLPLNQWVFNEAGQPMPICGADKKVYPAEKCTYRLMTYQEKLVAQFDL